MALHPANLLFLTVVLVSTLVVISTDSWLITWVALEMNIMSFIPLILKKNSYTGETALKYFLTQVVASVLILIALMGLSPSNTALSYTLLSALMIKLAAAPFHKWMPAIVSGMKWENVFILLVIQKIGPLMILALNCSYLCLDKFFYVFIITSAIGGAVMMLFQTTLQKMLAYSSIAHLSWILSLILLEKFQWLTYFMVYSMMTFSIISMLVANNLNFLSQLMSTPMTSLNKIMISTSLLSLGGLPPFSGFFPKMMALDLISTSSEKVLSATLIFSSLMSLFMYLRISLNTMFFKTSASKTTHKNKKTTGLVLVNFIFLFLGQAFCIYSF